MRKTIAMNEVTLVERIRMKNVERNKEMINVEKGAVYNKRCWGGADCLLFPPPAAKPVYKVHQKGGGGGGYTVLVGKCIQR